MQDIVDALMLASEKIDDGSPINAGREDRITLNQAANLVFKIVGWRPAEIIYDTSKPQGVASRAADATKGRKILCWAPTKSYEEGFKKTIDWYFSEKNEEEVKQNIERLLTER